MVTELQRIFGTNRFGLFQNTRNSFVLIEGGKEEQTKLWVAKLLPLFQME